MGQVLPGLCALVAWGGPAPAGHIERVSVCTAGDEANKAAGRDGGPKISADGWIIAFSSDASSLVPRDGNGARDVFVYVRFE